MAFAFDDLTTPVTAAEMRTSMYSVLAIMGVDATAWKPWSVLRALITGCSVIMAALSAMIAVIARGVFLSTAEGDWAEWQARENYGTERNAASFATTEVLISNSTGAVYDLDPGDYIIKNSVSGAQYFNTETVHVGSMAVDVACDVQAFEAGSASSSLAGELTGQVSAQPGLTCTNAAAAIGIDIEPIPLLKVRALESVAAISPNGPRDAYNYVAKGAKRADGSLVGVTRTQANPDNDGLLGFYLAGDSGAIPSPDVTIVDALLQEQATPLGTTLAVYSAAAVPVNVTYHVWMPAALNITPTDALTAINATLAAYFKSLPIGGFLVGVDRGLWGSGLESAIGQATTSQGLPLGIFRVEVTPSGLVPLGIGDVAVAGTLTGTITQV